MSTALVDKFLDAGRRLPGTVLLPDGIRFSKYDRA